MIFCTLVLDPNGNRNVLVLNENAGKRNLNLNWFDDRWNRSYAFAGVRRSLHSPPDFLSGEVSFIICLCQPPSILPTSFNFSEREINFLSFKIFISQVS